MTLVVVMKRGNARGAKGAGHRRRLGPTGSKREKPNVSGVAIKSAPLFWARGMGRFSTPGQGTALLSILDSLSCQQHELTPWPAPDPFDPRRIGPSRS
jgi:hypothetical protein